jgi:Rod binding domain-containing protein
MNLSQFQTSIESLQSKKAFAPPTPQHKKLVEQTRKWVGLTFFAPMLKQMREDPLADKMMDGGRGGEAFSSMYDQQISMHLCGGGGNKLVNGIVRRLEAIKAYGKQGVAAMKNGSVKNNMNEKEWDKEGADRMPRLRVVPGQSMIKTLTPESLTAGNAHDATDL